MADLVEVKNYISHNEDGPTIPEFFRGKSIFLTGGTGFMGKVLIEKLLWSCPDLECIYILLRPKKGKNSHQRLTELEKLRVFDRLRQRDPNCFLNKIRVVNGDVTQVGLGLSFEEKQMLIESVSIVFHAAASVRFDDALKDAILINTRGCREMMLLCQEMKKICVIVHVSTAYCNVDFNPIDEKLYPPHADWQRSIKIAESMDDYILQILTEKYLSKLPNTYVFTKRMAEHVVNDLRGEIPAVIFRPSIVISSLIEPMPGWLENFNGPIGLLIASGKGILRSVCCDSGVRLDYVGVDMAIKAMIIAAWKHGTKKNEIEPIIPVYNCCSSLEQGISYKDLYARGLIILEKTPFNDIVWLPGIQFTKFNIIHIFRAIFYQLIPALILDFGLKLSKQKPMLFKVQRKLYIASKALKLFINNEFLFRNDNFSGLKSCLLKSDIESFTYSFVDTNEYMKSSLMGARRYLLGEPDDTIPQAIAHKKKMYIVDKIVKTIFWIIVIWFLYNSACVRNIINETANAFSEIRLL